jgi:histidine ammonia-lyase
VARVYAAVRQQSPALIADRPLTADIERVAMGIREGRYAP